MEAPSLDLIAVLVSSERVTSEPLFVEEKKGGPNIFLGAGF